MTFEQFQKTFSGCKTRDAKPDEKITQGLTMLDAYRIERLLPEGFHEINEARDGEYRVCWESARHQAIVTYCEGDVTTQALDTPELFWRELRGVREYYRKLTG